MQLWFRWYSLDLTASKWSDIEQALERLQTCNLSNVWQFFFHRLSLALLTLLPSPSKIAYFMTRLRCQIANNFRLNRLTSKLSFLLLSSCRIRLNWMQLSERKLKHRNNRNRCNHWPRPAWSDSNSGWDREKKVKFNLRQFQSAGNEQMFVGGVQLLNV